MLLEKSTLLNKVRSELNSSVESINLENITKQNKTKKLNKIVKEYKDNLLSEELSTNNTNDIRLKNILLINYTMFVFGLESRNKLWNYDYMAFSRRIGELWEPFCKLAFEYPVTDLRHIEPKKFIDIKNEMINGYTSFIGGLNINNEDKTNLKEYIDNVWGFVDSGAVNLSLDMHIEYNNMKINVDFKSGFNSNEKGNTNRLLTVGSIYDKIYSNNKNIILVRAEEDENNHYLRTLSNSSIWEVYCGENTYNKIAEFTGFDLKTWINENIIWESDLDEVFYQYLIDNDLEKYLRW